MAARVLVVDDDPDTVDMLGELLERVGFDVSTSTDGPAAIEFARRAAPDVVVLDLIMTGISGLDILKGLRSAQATAAVLVIVVTGANRGEQADALAAGAAELFVKPVPFDELLAAIRRVSDKGVTRGC